MEDYKTLDEVVYHIYCWFQGQSKNDSTIVLNGFDRHNEAHLALFHIASMEKKIFNYKLKINCKLVDFIWMKLHFHRLVDFSWCKYDTNRVDCAGIVKTTDSMFEEDVLVKVYRRYYERK